MKKKKVVLTKEQKKTQNEIISREKLLKEKQEELQKEAEALDALRRSTVMANVHSFSLNKLELDAFVSALDNFPGKRDLAQAIFNAAQTLGVTELGQLNTKLVRLGFV